MSEKDKLSIIIVSYNTKEYLKKCIDSIIKKIKSVEYEVIIVDNSSTDGSVEYLSKFCAQKKNFVLVKNRENVGFATANNIGIQKSKSEFILLLNSDTKILNDFFAEIVEWLKNNKKSGVATCSLLNPDGTIQGSGGYFPNLLRVFSWMVIQDLPLVDRFIKPFHPMKEKSLKSGADFYRKSIKLDWVTGAFFLIRKQVFDDVGAFDEDYFMYTEEVDLCYRASKKGWEAWYLPQWNIIHYGGVSGSREFSVLSEFKGIKTFYKKHYPAWQYPVLRILLKIGSLGRIIVMGLKEGSNGAKIYAKAFIVA